MSIDEMQLGMEAEQVQQNVALTLLLPAFNEGSRQTDEHPDPGDRLRHTLTMYHTGLFEKFGPDFQIIVLDDGSTDNTAEIVKEEFSGFKEIKLLGHADGENRGRGSVLKLGFLAAARGNGAQYEPGIRQSDTVLYTDADGSYSLDTLIELYDNLKSGAHMAVAYRDEGKPAGEQRNSLEAFRRYVVGSYISHVLKTQPQNGNRSEQAFPQVEQQHDSMLRKIAHVALRAVCEPIAPTHARDPQAGAKGLAQAVVGPIASLLNIEGWAADRQMLYIAHRAGLRVVEVPATIDPQGDSRVHMVRDAYRMVRDSLKIRIKGYRDRKSIADISRSNTN
jgi:dolichyl-phosphate beta-glucosyltransferase